MDSYANVSRLLGFTETAQQRQKSSLQPPGSEQDRVVLDGGETPGLENAQDGARLSPKGRLLSSSQQFGEKLGEIVGTSSDAEAEKTDSVTLPLGDNNVTLDGVKTIDLNYFKRPDEEHKQLRKEFNSKVRKRFIKDLASDPEKVRQLQTAGLTDSDLKMMGAGKVPPGYSVHHKIPLDDSGGNEFSNFVLIENKPAHEALTNYQIRQTEGMVDGDSRQMKWPMPEGFIYPPEPGMIHVSPKE